MCYSKEDLPKIKEGVEKNLPNVKNLIGVLDQRSDIDPRVRTLLKSRFIIPKIQEYEETIDYIRQLINDDVKIKTFELLHAASRIANIGKTIAKDLMIDIEDCLAIEFLGIPENINNQVNEVLTRFSSEDKQRFSLE